MTGILFDAGNTLVHIDPHRMVEIYEAVGVQIDVARFQRLELEARRALHDGIEQGHKGTEPELWHEYFVSLFSLSGVPAPSLPEVSERVRHAHAESHLWTHALPGTIDVLRSLVASGYRVGVISNADGRMEGALERAGVRPHVEFVIDSARVGVEKPAARIFHTGCEEMGLPPEACMYVGDLLPVDYVGARAAGLAAVLLDPLGLYDERAETVPSLDRLPEWLGARPF